MRWNYRVLRQVEDHHGQEHVFFGIHEVYYDESGRPTTCTMEQIAPFGETLDELRADVEMIAKALDLPVLDYDSIGLKEDV